MDNNTQDKGVLRDADKKYIEKISSGKVAWKRIVLICAIVFSVLFLSITYFFLLYRNQSTSEGFNKVVDVLQPIIIAAIFAYIMKSTANFYERGIKKMLLRSGKREEKSIANFANVVSVILTYITWIALITGLLVIAIPQIVKSITDFANMLIIKIPEYMDILIEWERKFLADQEMLRPYFDKLVIALEEWTETDLIPWIQSTVTGMIPKLLGLVTSIADIVIGLVISVFILLGRKALARKSMMFLHCIFQKEKTVNVVADEFRYADKMFSGFLEGKVIDSAIIGIVYYIVLEIMNVPYAALVAVICGVTNIIPIFGPYIGAIPSGFIIMTAETIKVITFIIFVCVIQFLDGYIIDPHIVGGNIKISSFWVVFAVLIFGGLWGFFGLLIGVPTFAVIYDIFRKLSLYILKRRGKQDVIDKYRLETKSDKSDKKKKPEPIDLEPLRKAFRKAKRAARKSKRSEKKQTKTSAEAETEIKIEMTEESTAPDSNEENGEA